MNKIIKNPFTAKFPSIDIHGETCDTCVCIINDFIKDNIKLKNPNIIIIHGKSGGKLKKATHEVLKKNPNVRKYYVDMFNEGCTIVEIIID